MLEFICSYSLAGGKKSYTVSDDLCIVEAKMRLRIRGFAWFHLVASRLAHMPVDWKK
jgi:hypothetical protein